MSEEQIAYYTNCFLYLLEKTQGNASINGAVNGSDKRVLDFFYKSRLDNAVLASVWALCDVNEDGFLNHAEFVTAMHLIILHLRGSIPIPARLPPSIRPVHTPVRHLVPLPGGTFGTSTSPPPNNCSASTSNTSASARNDVATAASSPRSSKNSTNFENASIDPRNQPQQQQQFQQKFATIASTNGRQGGRVGEDTVDGPASDGKQHSLSDDHLHTSHFQREIEVAKFSDVPPLLVDSVPTALNAVPVPNSSSLIAALTVGLSSGRGPPPQPPPRDYMSGGKGHGRSASLDLKTFAALSLHPSQQFQALVSSQENYQTGELGKLIRLAMDNDGREAKAVETQTPAPEMEDKGTQTVCSGSNYQEAFSFLPNEMDDQLSPAERCHLLKRVNEQLEVERATLMQVRLQVHLRIEEAEAKLREMKKPSPTNTLANKPTML